VAVHYIVLLKSTKVKSSIPALRMYRRVVSFT
jgi:hypothetical protein